MIKIRLTRGGVRKKPFYKIVAANLRSKNQGKNLEVLGFWQPSKNLIRLNKDALAKWEKEGAKISPAVEKLLKTKAGPDQK